MNPRRFSTLLTACGLACAAPALFAEEEIKPAAPPNAEQPENAPSSPGPKHRFDGERHREGDRHGPKPEMKPTSYIGVMTHGMTPELAAQTGLADGFGLVVEDVMPDSPALAAGIRQHDVLVLFGDQRLVNQEQLSALVRAEKKDAEVVFTLKRAGTDQKITVKIGETEMPVANHRGPDGSGPFYGLFNGRDTEHLGDQLRENAERIQRELRENGGRIGQELRENGERIGEGLKQWGERMKEWSRNGKNQPAPPPPPQFNRDGDHRDGPPPAKDERPGGNGSSTSSSSSSNSTSIQRNVTRRDDTGEYTLREDNGAKVFTVKPKDGEEQTFIVNTDKQRDAIPENFRAKLRELENLNPPAPAKVEPRTGN